MSIGVVVALVVLTIVVALAASSTSTPHVSTRQTVTQTSAPMETTTSAPLPTTTTSQIGAATTAPPTTGIGSLEAASPAFASSASAPANIAIFGDSIAQIATPDLTRALRSDNALIDAVGGTTMADHLPKIEQVASEGKTRDWVIELGTNDAIYDHENPNWPSDLANEVAALQTQQCVVFVTINPRVGPMSISIDEAIASAVASHSNFHSLDWGDIEFNKAKWLLPDGIHPSKSGSSEFAKLVKQAILGCPGQ